MTMSVHTTIASSMASLSQQVLSKRCSNFASKNYHQGALICQLLPSPFLVLTISVCLLVTLLIVTMAEEIRLGIHICAHITSLSRRGGQLCTSLCATTLSQKCLFLQSELHYLFPMQSHGTYPFVCWQNTFVLKLENSVNVTCSLLRLPTSIFSPSYGLKPHGTTHGSSYNRVFSVPCLSTYCLLCLKQSVRPPPLPFSNVRTISSSKVS